MRLKQLVTLAAIAMFALSSHCQQTQSVPMHEQNDAEKAAGSVSAQKETPLSTPSMTGPLQAAPPIRLDAGPFGGIALNGIVSGFGLVQSNATSGDAVGQATLSNGQIWVQKPDGAWQFYVQAGAYNIVALGTPFMATGKQVDTLWGPVPVAYLKILPARNTSIQVGQLPALMGAEYTFDFENMQIERGLLWNQENSINRGVQMNQNMGKLTASLSWNDGYYSNRYSWLSGSMTYTQGAHSVAFMGMGNLSGTAQQTIATPVQNNGNMYMLQYTFTRGGWIMQSYAQYGRVPRNRAVGIPQNASTMGGAALLSKALGHGYSMTARSEYIVSSGKNVTGAANLLYGPASAAWSATLTPTFQRGRLFVRGEGSLTRAVRFTAGDAFGKTGTGATQARGILEAGILF